jgi:hypothetical protein
MILPAWKRSAQTCLSRPRIKHMIESILIGAGIAVVAIIALHFIRLKKDSPGHVDISHMGLVSKPMDEARFWDIIQRSLPLKELDDDLKQEEFLKEELMKEKPEDIVGFYLRTEKLARAMHLEHLRCEHFLLNDGNAEDEFEDFCYWVISLGKQVYEKAIKDPDSLAEQYNEGITYYGFILFQGIAEEAFTYITDEELSEHIDTDNMVSPDETYPDIEAKWDPSDYASLHKLCPRLFEIWKDRNLMS